MAPCQARRRLGPRETDAGRRIFSGPVSVDPQRGAARTFLRKYRIGTIWNTNGIADALVAHLSAPVKDYPFVRAVIAELPSKIEDNVTADLVNRLPLPISVIGLTSEGRAMLDVLYQAMITGDVSKYERKQADKIIAFRMGRVSESEFVGEMSRRMIFPIRNIGITRQATATFRAALLPNGKVKVRYTSVRVVQYDMFADDVKTLPDWTHLSNGIELDPNQIVAVHLYDLETRPVVDIPALALIDYSNQIQEKTIGTAATAFFLGLTLGSGALGGGVISGLRARVALGEVSKAWLWGARAVIWADRVQFGIQAGSMIINDHRDWIVETFPNAGPGLLDAVDTANRIAGYYGWARLGIDGLRFIRAKMGPAVEAWRSARQSAKLGSKQASVARAVEDEADMLLAELQHAEEQAAAKGARGLTTPPVGAKARKVVAGGKKEIHVTRDRIEICPIQRCPDLKETVGPAIADSKVAKEVAEAEKAAHAGDAVGAATRAEAALMSAGATGSGAKSPAPATTPAKAPKVPPGKPGRPPNASDIAARGYPLGFRSLDQFKYFGWSGKGWLKSRGYANAEIGIQGSAVSGYSASGHGPFDAGRVSDLDVAVVSPGLFDKARAAGIPVRDGHTRFALTPEQAGNLAVADLSSRLAGFVGGRKINLMVFESRAAAMSKEPATMWHWW
jgi:hypothetical protein